MSVARYKQYLGHSPLSTASVRPPRLDPAGKSHTQYSGPRESPSRLQARRTPKPQWRPPAAYLYRLLHKRAPDRPSIQWRPNQSWPPKGPAPPSQEPQQAHQKPGRPGPGSPATPAGLGLRALRHTGLQRDRGPTQPPIWSRGGKATCSPPNSWRSGSNCTAPQKAHQQRQGASSAAPRRRRLCPMQRLGSASQGGLEQPQQDTAGSRRPPATLQSARGPGFEI
ncbi:hypothetical protein NDU88_002603 [Pleurodeles waltl]|uniref:Uncharacterized protein n=1 Tax=Pleurodeles waltl TaxID=8319 RepID=A0AAV7LEJ8_PLEWA|nr:hypothetical protein NDU88_002603 [Pleurodeles waltl]